MRRRGAVRDHLSSDDLPTVLSHCNTASNPYQPLSLKVPRRRPGSFYTDEDVSRPKLLSRTFEPCYLIRKQF